jgi:hypothetical protein
MPSFGAAPQYGAGYGAAPQYGAGYGAAPSYGAGYGAPMGMMRSMQAVGAPMMQPYQQMQAAPMMPQCMNFILYLYIVIKNLFVIL